MGSVGWRLPGIVLCLLVAGGAAAEDPATPPPGRIEFVGENLVWTANGTFHDWRVVESRIDPDAPDASYVVVEIDLASVDTGIARRDRHLRTEDFFHVDRHPVATARVHSPGPVERGDDGRRRFSARIDLDLHGVRKTLDAEVTIESESPPVFSGATTLDRTDFGIGAEPGWNPMTPDAQIPVRFRVELPLGRFSPTPSPAR